MLKIYCDICEKEIDKTKELMGSFRYVERKLDFVKHKPERVVKEVELILCEKCVDGAKSYFEGQKNVK